MNTEIVVALIGLLGVVVSVIATAKSTQNSINEKINTENQVQNEKLDQLNKDVQTNMLNVKNELTLKIESSQAITDLKFAHMAENIEIMKKDIASHNHYAQLFSETVPVLTEQQKNLTDRITKLESYHIDEK